MMVFGTVLMSRTVDAFTWARYPQKSQIRSAHLKFGGSRTSVFDRLHFGRERPVNPLWRSDGRVSYVAAAA